MLWKNLSVPVACCTVAAVCWFGGSAAARRDQDPLSAADKAFADKTYQDALDRYRALEKDSRYAGSRDHVVVRIGQSLARLNRADEAREVLAAYAKEKPGTNGARLALIERGTVTLTMPHHYYEKDGRKHRGQWVQGGVYHWTQREDLLDGTADLEAARKLGLAQRATPAWDDAAAASHARGLLELAAGLEQLKDETFVAERRDPTDAAYGALEKWLDRMFAAFDEAVATEAARKNAEAEALALYLKGSAARRVLGSYRTTAAGLEVPKPEGQGLFETPPEGRDPIKIMLAAREKARGLASEDAFLFGLATTRLHFGRYVDAVADHRELIKRFPKSVFAHDSEWTVEQTVAPRLGVSGLVALAPDAPFEVPLDTRNAAEVEVALYRFDAAKLWLGNGFLNDEDLAFGDLGDALKESGWTPRDADRVFAGVHRTGDDGTHQPLKGALKIPGQKVGAYLLRVETHGLVRVGLANVSDLALVTKTDEGRTYAYVADAKTGRPVKGADVVVRERWTKPGFLGGRRWVERHVRDVTNDDGVLVVSHQRNERGESSTIETLAVDGPRLALAPAVHVWTPHPAERSSSVYVMTDRPVYRPGDPVKFAALATHAGEEGRLPSADRVFHVTVSDPKGAKIFDRELRTDQDGAFEQELVLGKEPPLGVYAVIVAERSRTIRHANFRVEEYLKPEFKVTIEPGAGETRLGEKAKAVILAEYYFGGGVAGGEVSWKVLREPWRPAFRRNEPWRHLYGAPPEDEGPASNAAGRVLVASGSGALNSDGRFELLFDTAPWKDEPGDGSRFTVQADVTDASRRTISGEDEVVVARRALALDVTSKRRFARVGETVELELQSVLTSGAGVAVKGEIKTSLVKTKAGGRPGETIEELSPLDAFPAATDEKGLGFFRTVFDSPGYYSVRFEARDAFEQLCFAEVRFWVHGPGFRADGFEMKNLELIAERRTWKKGETALVLVHANLPDCAVFFTVEAGRRVIASQTLRLSGKTALLEIPIGDEHAPNVHLHAITVRDGGFFEESLELFVPPVEKFVNVSAAFARPDYKPGETGELVVTTTNSAGAPIAARSVVTVLDASLFYIQNDVTPDIRKFFYGERRYAGVTHQASSGFGYGVETIKDYLFKPFDDLVGQPAAWWLRPGLATELKEGGALTAETLLGWWGEGLAKDGGRTGGVAGGERLRLGAARPAASTPAPSGRAELKEDKYTAKLEAANERELRDHDAAPGDEESAAPDIAVRTDFRDAAFWSAAVRTDASGRATIKVPFPESTTLWRAKAWTWTGDLKVGEAVADARTTKNLVVRLRAPRFFVEGDVTTVTATVNNRATGARSAKVSLDLGDGATLATDDPVQREIEAAAGGVARVDWKIKVLRAGEAKIAVRAWSADDADGLAKTYPVYEWGAEKRLFDGAILDGDASRTLTFLIPEERRTETAEIRVTLQPSLALTLIDALPYLIQYPYGCTEQTVSRFAPAAVVARTLREAGTTLTEVLKKRRDLPRSDAQGAGRDRAGFAYELDDVVQAGLARLRSLQHADGGFGWWKDGDSDVYMTSYALQGLLIAREADVRVDDGLIVGAAGYLKGALPAERRLETAAFGAYVLARAAAPAHDVAAKVFASRDKLSLYGRALLASALKYAGKNAEAALVVKAFDDSVERDAADGTAHWGYNGGGWWFWWNSRVETNAAILHALLDVAPSSPHVAPLAKWLAMNRRGNRWTNTRDTAHAIFALIRYARAAGEFDPDLEVEVDVAGAKTKTVRIDRKNLFAFDNVVAISADAVRTGPAAVTVRTKGRGRCYVAAEAGFFTKESDIGSAGRELLVEREYVKVATTSETKVVDGKETTVVAERFEPLAAGATLVSGDVVEVRLKIDSKNDYEHLLFEDFKPAGFEPLEVRSGARYADGVVSNVEFRDAKTALFATWLEQGTHVLRYRLRAEIPGVLRARPARGEAMYAPDVGGTSTSFRIVVRDSDTR
jgi:alpha-2-macroglobulin